VHKKPFRTKEGGKWHFKACCWLPSHQIIDGSSSYTVTVSSTLLDIVFVKLFGQEEIIDPKFPLGIVGIHPILECDMAIQLPNQSFTVSIE
jgi:hypothetical protein